MATDETTVSFVVNGQRVAITVPVRKLLADVLRDDLGLTGTHLGCEQGVCGSCTVQVDGVPMRSCLILGVQADGHIVSTVEGLAKDGAMHPVQEAFQTYHALQCGFCTPGFLMTVSAAYDSGKEVRTEDDVDALLESHICRCTGYINIKKAVGALFGVE